MKQNKKKHCDSCTCSGGENLDELINEHERLVAVLKSKSRKDDLKEVKIQQKELQEYKDQKSAK